MNHIELWEKAKVLLKEEISLAEFVQGSEHASVAHVVAVDDRVIRRQLDVAVAVQERYAFKSVALVEITVQVEFRIVRRIHHGEIDRCAVDEDPADHTG